MRGVGGCIDVSDGLEADLDHLLGPAGLAAEIDPAALPLPRGFRAACQRLGLDPEELARTGGEDYELLFTLPQGRPSTAELARRLGVPVSQIGTVLRSRTGGRAQSDRKGWRHF
jgi:thiamine-monophosphate kinase